MKLIVGLGNPGKKYETTRHNIGFLAIDNYVKSNNLTYKADNNFNAVYVKTNNVILLKPQTFMNLSGESVIKFINYYKINIEDVLIIYDDISIPFNNVRIRTSGSAGGHNGIKNLILHLKTQEFKRVRLGVDNNASINLVDYVLGNFTKTELNELNYTFDDINNLINDFISNEKFDSIMNKYNKKG